MLGIEGFDAETVDELQARARGWIEQREAALQERRRALGVEDALAEVPGISSAMLVALGENEVKTVEDLAGCATDDLVGWVEKKGNDTVRIAGYFSELDVSREEAETLIMAARVAAGWVEPEADAPAEVGEADAEEAADA
jgi:N utilization substance protein A